MNERRIALLKHAISTLTIHVENEADMVGDDLGRNISREITAATTNGDLEDILVEALSGAKLEAGESVEILREEVISYRDSMAAIEEIGAILQEAGVKLEDV